MPQKKKKSVKGIQFQTDDTAESRPSPLSSPYVGPPNRRSPPPTMESPYLSRAKAQNRSASFNATDTETGSEAFFGFHNFRSVTMPPVFTASSAVDNEYRNNGGVDDARVPNSKGNNVEIENEVTLIADEETPLMDHRSSSHQSSSGSLSTKNDDDTAGGGLSIIEKLEEGFESTIETLQEVTVEALREFDEHRHYDWREFWKGGSIINFARWLATGFNADVKHSDEEIQEKISSLAHLLSLLREYHGRFGMPMAGGPKDQEYVLKEVTKDLYAGGAPIWALEPVMKKVAEGLTGKRGVDFFMLPRRAFIFAPSSGATSMFIITRGYDMQLLDAMESVAVRLASFASNTTGVASVPARWPNPQELRQAFGAESETGSLSEKEELAEEILTLASEAEGLFFFINSQQYKAVKRNLPMNGNEGISNSSQLGEFWTVEDTTRELFSRLACLEAANAMDKMDAERKPLYSPGMVMFFRWGSSAGACAFWFNGSWIDMLVAGTLGIMVGWIGSSAVLSKQERIIFESVASFVVGVSSGCIALRWPAYTCFTAMAISGVLDMLQGFRIVYSIIEIMSRHTVTGGADFLEGVFFTALIAYFLRFGQYVSLQIMGNPENNAYQECDNGISEWWFLFFVPLASVCWSGLFNPNYVDLPFMGAHGVIGYVVSWQFYTAASTTNLNNFLAAMCVTFSAGIISRFTGRQALGNTVAGLYVLVPGAYLVTEVYKNKLEGFLSTIILRAVIIGIGAWTGTILCSPTLLGMNRGLIQHSSGMPTLVSGPSDTASTTNSVTSVATGTNFRRRDKNAPKKGTGALLFF